MSKHYAEFKVGELFSLKSTSSGIDGNKLNTTAGEIPYVTRSVNENGIKQYVTDEQIAGKNQDKGNVITIGLDTQTAYYQPVSFFTGQNVHILDHEKMSQKLAMYLIPQLIKIMQKYSWGGNGATLGRLREDTITLPITDDTIDSDSPEPDWEYMESYIKSIEEKYLDSVEKYNRRNEEILDVLHPDYHGEEPEAYDYAEFKVGELFEITPTKWYKNNPVVEEEISVPQVSNTTQPNGITSFENYPANNDGNVITFSDTTVGGETLFYQPVDFIGYSHVQKMVPIGFELNQKIAHYVISAFRKAVDGKFNYAAKFNRENASNTLITLPVTSDGEPDWVFMEEYINFIEGGGRREIANYVQHKRRTS